MQPNPPPSSQGLIQSPLTAEPIADLGSFVNKITAEARKHTLFRGQPERWELVPGIGRIAGANQQVERRYLDRFQKLGARLVETSVKSEWEWLSVAQHRGMRTRLLDWTPNPLVALWFALAGHRDEHTQPVVFALEPDPASDENHELPESPFEIQRVSIYRPFDLDSRIRAQASIFTAHPWSNVKRDRMVPISVASGTGDLRPGQVREYPLRRQAVNEIRNQLKNCGLNGFSLFPDLEGLARTLTADLLSELASANATAGLIPPEIKIQPGALQPENASAKKRKRSRH